MADTSTGSTLSRLKQQVASTYDLLRESPLDVEKYDPSRHDGLIGFDGIPGHQELDRYWVNVPFAFVSMNYDPSENDTIYHVVEPELADWEATLLETVASDLRRTLIHRREAGETNTEAVIDAELRGILEEYGVVVEEPTFYRLLYYLDRRFRGFGKIDPIMRDPNIEDVSCDGYDVPIFVYHDQYTDLQTNITLDEAQLDDFVVRLAQQSGRSISIAEPITDATLPDGSRCEFALGNEVTPHGSAFTIRKYQEDPMTPVSLMDVGTFSLDQMAYLWLAIQHNKSLIFAGGTASGKTTSMNAISMFIPPGSKVLTIEDTQEIRLHHTNWLPAVTRESVGDGTDLDMYDLLRSALRHRPEYLIVGEVRGREAMTLFQAMNTGHTTYSTMHADSIQTVINRLENDPINVSRSLIQMLDILSVQQLSRIGGERVRRTRTISEIIGIDQRSGDLEYSDVFSWDPATDEYHGHGAGSNVIQEIREDNGWTVEEIRQEFINRKRVLRYAQRRRITDFQNFTALVNEYYTDPDDVLARVDDDELTAPIDG